MPLALLLAMQAAGMIVDYYGVKNQQEMADMGAKLQQAGIDASIQQTRLETEDASLSALKNLRQTMGSQLAIFAARGTNPAAGSALSMVQSSIGTNNADERMRRLNLLGKENQLKGGGVISKLNQQSNNAALWQGFAQRSINRFPTNPSAFGSASKSFGLTGNV